jgi:DNA polymerase-3 subunit gamma/tau
VLYRKYRSQNFSELIGQDNIVKVLRQSILENRIAHAYLFSGPRGTGKTSTARILAKALNCNNQVNGEPCNECSRCLSIGLGKYMDLIEIDGASNRGIEEIRDLKEKVGFLPVEGKYKIYIIDEVHMLTGEAFNALLKTLEEPPQNVIFIFATTEIQKVPVTILSRTQRFDFKLATEDDLSKKLNFILEKEGIETEDGALEIIVRGGMGSFRDSETILDKVISSLPKSEKLSKLFVENLLGYADSETIEKFVNMLVNNNRMEALNTFSALVDQGINLSQFSRQLLEYLRNSIIELIKKQDNRKIRQFMIFIKEFNQASTDIKFSLLPRLNIELAIINATSDQDDDKKVIKQEVIIPVEKHIEKHVKPIVQVLPKKIEHVEVELPKVEVKKTMNLDFSQIKDKWYLVMSEVKNHHSHLSAMINTAQIRESENGISIVVAYPLHKNMINGTETKKTLNEILKKIYGTEVAYDCIVDKSIQNKNAQSQLKGNEDLVENILQ